jgi:predicted nucleic acid-binding protein
MKTVLDANIIIADFRFNSTDSKILLESSKKGNIDLYVPEIVLDEVFNKFEERLAEAQSKTDKELSVIKKITNTKVKNKINEDFIDEKVTEYKKYIYNLFDKNNVEILKYPNVPHKKIVYKAIKKIKPFNTNEKGYRDALIWENIKSLMPETGINIANPDIVFITNNKKDFCESENDLHRELIKELEEEYLDIESIKVYNNLNDFSNNIKQLFFIQENSFKKRIESGKIEDFDLENMVLTSLREELNNSDISEIESIPHSYQDSTVRFIEKIDNLKIKDIRKLNSTEYLIDLTCNAEMTIDFYMDKSDYYSSDDITYDVEDLDWNDYVIWASELVNPELLVSLVIDNGYNITSIQIN